MKFISKIIIAAMLICCLGAFASCTTPEETGGELALELSHDGDYYMVIGIGTHKGKEVVIPSEYDGIPVKMIDNCAFENCTEIEKVTVPEGVEYMGNFAFGGCTALKEIVIPSTVKKLNDGMFSGCTALYEIIIPASVTRIEFRTFEACSSLVSIEFGGKTSDWNAIQKSPMWNIGTGDYTVYCSNGELAQ